MMVFAVSFTACNKDEDLELIFQKNVSGNAVVPGADLRIMISANKTCNITLELDGTILTKVEGITDFKFALPTFEVGSHTLQIFGETDGEKTVSYWVYYVGKQPEP